MSIHLPLVSPASRLRGLFAVRRQRRPRHARAGPEVLEARTVLLTYTMPMVNDTLLTPSTRSTWAAFPGNNLTLQRSKEGVLVSPRPGRNVDHLQGGTEPGDYHQINSIRPSSSTVLACISSSCPKGGRHPRSPTVRSRRNPHLRPYLFTYVELTNPNNGAPPTVDLSTVDGFSFPVTLKLNGKHGAVGQPPDSPHVNRQSVISEYSTFMKANAGGQDYTVLELPNGAKADGQSEGLLNPYFYLRSRAGRFAAGEHHQSAEHGLRWRPEHVVRHERVEPQGDFNDQHTNYTATAGTYQYGKLTNPYSGNPLKLPGLQFQGAGTRLRVQSGGSQRVPGRQWPADHRHQRERTAQPAYPDERAGFRESCNRGCTCSGPWFRPGQRCGQPTSKTPRPRAAARRSSP